MITVTADKPAMTIKGAKAGQEQPRKSKISKDTASSTSTIKVLYGLGEGEVQGLVNGGNSIYLEGTPLLDAQGQPNFEGITWDFRHGTNDQDYIQGFPDVSNETGIGVELKQVQPYIKAFNDTQVSALRIRFKFGRLAKTDDENGDVSGVKVTYAIDLQTDGSPYTEILLATVEDKASAGYERTHRIDLPKATTGWQIRIRRITPDSDSDFLQDKMSIDAIAEVIDVKLRYPNTALLGLQYDAELFGNVAKMSARIRGKIIRVPSNYNANNRTYTGIWDGTFIDAYSNNPAWVYYDLCCEWRYGLGDKLTANMIDKWSLYQLGQYCDAAVSDGMGGTEPRFTCNVYIQQQADAYQVLSNIAGIFRAMSYWNGEKIIIDADVPQDPIYTFSSANVVNGIFEYTGTRQRDRHTLVKVAWDNPANEFQTEYEYVRDEEALAKFGVKVLDLSAFGCTSQAQAQRAGLWALRTEQLETRQVAFSVGLDGFIPQVGNIINVNDELFAGRANGGRVSAVSDAQYVVTVDRDLTATDGNLVINGSDGLIQKRSIKSIVGRKITLNAPFDNIEPENIWAIETPDLKLMRFRVMSIGQGDEQNFNIVAIQHEPTKYLVIDGGAYIDPSAYPENNIVANNSMGAPESVSVSARYRTDQGVTVTTLVIDWTQVKKAVLYDIEYRKDSGSWFKLPQSSSVGTEVDAIYSGNYTARVRAISPFGVQSKPTESAPTFIESKIQAPTALNSFFAQGILFGMYLSWAFGDDSNDTAYTEIEQATAPDVNIEQLGTYAYPTNSVTIQDMPPNLTVFYRARVVDKFDLKSDWTEWAQATTSADAQAVLDLLNGKIGNSQLDQSLTTQISKISDTEQDIIAEREARISDILDERNARIDSIATVQDGIMTETTQRKASDLVINNTITTVKSSVSNNLAAITSESSTRADEDSALSTRIDTVFAKAGNNLAAITSESSTRADEDSALSTRIDTVTSKTENNSASLVDEIATRTSQNTAMTERLTIYESKVDDNTATIATTQSTVANNTTTIANVRTELKADFSNNTAAIIASSKVSADANKATADSVETLQTSVNGNTASIQTQQSSIDGLYGQYTVKVDVNGRVSGFGLASTDTASEFAIRADRFYIAPPDGSGIGDAAFIYQATPYTDPDTGTVIPAGLYLKDAFIKNASIGTLQIAGNSIIVPRTQYTETQVDFSLGSGEVEINSLTVDAAGGSVSINFGFERLFATPNGNLILRVKRNGATIKTMQMRVESYANGIEEYYYQVGDEDKVGWRQLYTNRLDYSFGSIPSFADTPPLGNNTYSITLQMTEGGTASIKSRSLFLMSVKR